MRYSILTVLALAVIFMSSLAEDEVKTTPMKGLPSGMKGSYETVEGKVLKVFSAEDNGAKFHAYLVKWKDFEVVVSDNLGRSDKKEGDTITFMVSRTEFPMGDKKISTLSFMIMDFGAFMPRKEDKND